jgi:hypothetical protein
MEEPPRASRTGIVAGVIAAGLGLLVLALAFDLGPFADEDLSAAEFIAQGDEICAEAHEEFLEVQNSTPRTAQDAEDQLEALIELAEEERDALLDLSPPASLDGPLEDYISKRERGIELLERGLSAARDDNPAAYEVAQAELAATQRARQRSAEEVGFNRCSEPLVSEGELERQAQPPAPGG